VPVLPLKWPGKVRPCCDCDLGLYISSASYLRAGADVACVDLPDPVGVEEVSQSDEDDDHQERMFWAKRSRDSHFLSSCRYMMLLLLPSQVPPEQDSGIHQPVGTGGSSSARRCIG
jgi:hypothetical protein